MDNQPSGYTQGAGDNNGGRSDGAFAEQHQQQHQQQGNKTDNQRSGSTQGAGGSNGGNSDGAFAQQQQHQQQGLAQGGNGNGVYDNSQPPQVDDNDGNDAAGGQKWTYYYF